eukprot:m.9087 g.9087  ORF g.9087 m.9087 type:complete len:119 (+) comp5388_c0_seq1:86-442(+)
MASVQKKPVQQDEPASHRIRITLTCTKVGVLEKVCTDLLNGAKSRNIPVKGPVRLPTKFLRITSRKTPCGEGSKTWDRYEMRVHKRLIDLTCAPEVVKQITAINIDRHVTVEVTVAGQ